MEYFLPLSVMAMIISSISIFLIDYQTPTTSNTDPENDQSTPNPSEKLEGDTVDEFTVSENEENLQKSSTPTDIPDENALDKIHSTQSSLKAFQETFSMLWDPTPKSKITTSQS